MKSTNGLGLLNQKKYTVGKAAEALGISRNTFKKYLAMGELPTPITVGTQQFWLEQDLESWLMAQNPHLAARETLRNQAMAAVKKQRSILGLVEAV